MWLIVGRLCKFVIVALAVTSQVISKVAPVEKTKEEETAGFWTAAANDEKLETWQRGLAVYFLFERHVKAGITLGTIAETLKKPDWIKLKNTRFMQAGSPFMAEQGESVLAIEVFPRDRVENRRKYCTAIYLHISGEIDEKDFLSTVNGEKSKL